MEREREKSEQRGLVYGWHCNSFAVNWLLFPAVYGEQGSGHLIGSLCRVDRVATKNPCIFFSCEVYLQCCEFKSETKQLNSKCEFSMGKTHHSLLAPSELNIRKCFRRLETACAVVQATED